MMMTSLPGGSSISSGSSSSRTGGLGGAGGISSLHGTSWPEEVVVEVEHEGEERGGGGGWCGGSIFTK